MDHQEFITDVRSYAVEYFASHKFMSWGDDQLHVSLRGMEFGLRIFPLENPGDPSGPPIIYLDLVYCGHDSVAEPETMSSNILARVATVNPWQDGIEKALDDLLVDADAVLDENPPWLSGDEVSRLKDRGVDER